MSRLDDLLQLDLGALLGVEEAVLVEQMDIRLREAEEDPASAGRLDGMRIATSHAQGMADIRAAAERVYRRLNREIHDLCCGAATSDKADRRRIREALQISDLVGAGALAHVMIQAGTSPAIASVVAALLIRRIIQPAGEELCAYWATKLD